MSKKKRNKPYKPRDVKNPIELTIGRYKPIDKGQIQNIELFLRTHFTRLVNGTGDEAALWYLSAQLEVAILCFEYDNTIENKDELTQACKTAMQGVLRAVERFEKCGRVGLDGDTYRLCSELLTLHIAHIKTLGSGIVNDAINECKARAGRGYLEVAA